MRFARWTLVMVAIGVGVFASARWTLWAQDRGGRAGHAMPEAVAAPRGEAAISVQDALIRPFDFPFADPITLTDACAVMGRALNIGVALDRAALDRQDVLPEDEVQLDLKGARLKVGLKLLLDPLGLTYRIEPEDNLLIITDAEGSEDPAALALAELKSLHREVHDLQDAVDDLRDLVEEDLGFEPESDPNRTTVVGLTPAVRPAKPLASRRPFTAPRGGRRGAP